MIYYQDYTLASGLRLRFVFLYEGFCGTSLGVLFEMTKFKAEESTNV